MTGFESPTHSDTAIDRTILARLFELQDEADPHLVAELIEMFFASSPDRITRLRRALQAGDLRAIETTAHDFKSSAANLGALRLSAIAADLELCGRKGNIVPVPQLVEALEREFERARQELAPIAKEG